MTDECKMSERCVKGGGTLKARSVQEEKRRKAVALLSEGNEEQEIERNYFYNTQTHSSLSQRVRKKTTFLQREKQPERELKLR